MSGLEETGPEDPFQTRELLAYGNSGELLIEDSSPDEASSEP